MDIIHFDPNSLRAQVLTLEQAIQSAEVVWVDIYPHDIGWEKMVKRLLGFPLDEQRY